MVTRAFATREVREFRTELGAAQNIIRGTILPALGLSLAFNFLTGSMDSTTGAGVAMGQATFGIRSAFAELTDNIAVTLAPHIHGVTDDIGELIQKFNELDEEQQAQILRYGALAGGAYLFRGQLVALTRLLLTPAGAGTVGALLAGGLTFNTVRDIQEGGVDRATDPVTSRNAQAARQIQDVVTNFLGLPNVRRGYGALDDPERRIAGAREIVDTAIAPGTFDGPRETVQAVQEGARTVNNYFNITSHSTEQLLAQLQDALDQDLLRVP